MNISEVANEVLTCAAKADMMLEEAEAVEKQLRTAKAEQATLEAAQAVAIAAAHETQEKLSERITSIVQCALDTVFPMSNYTFRVEFGQRANKSQIELVLYENDNPVNDYGGGLRDIISFALRLAVQSLGTSDKVLILDEPMKFLSADMRDTGAQLLRELSQRLGMQVICVTHLPEIVSVADKAFVVTKTNGKSAVTER